MGKAFVAKLAKEGARDPEALAAWIGRKKHGPAAFKKLSAAGRRPGTKSGNPEASKQAPPEPAAPRQPKPRLGQSKQVSDVRDAFKQALAGDWERVPGRPGELKIRRTTTHRTPDNIPDKWWGEPTYEEHEFVSVLSDGKKILAAYVEESGAPWTGGRGAQKMSIKKLLQKLQNS
jgi:hypothetical protein